MGKSKLRYLKKFVGLRAGEEHRYLRRAGIAEVDEESCIRYRTCSARDLSATERVISGHENHTPVPLE